jgi:hypothetical protein
MKIIGIALRKPSFGEITSAAVLASGLWLAFVALSMRLGSTPDRADAGAALLVIFWGCVCVRLGIRVEQGVRHLALNLCCCALLIGAYQSVLTLFA